MMKRRHKQGACQILCLLAALLAVSVCTPIRVKARELSEGKSIVFLLDASGSMKSNDPQRLAIDSIAQLIYSLPSDYQVGFVAYNSEITANLDFVLSDQRNQIMEEAETIEYIGYSDAGTGLEYAVGMLADQQADEKHVVMLSDGEILMKDDASTESSKQQYQQAVQQAADVGIRIHVIGLGDEMEDMNNFIFSAAEATNGKSFYTPQAMGIQEATDSVLTEELGIKQSTIAIIDADGGTETVSAELPYTHADKVRVLLTSSAPITNLTANFQADSAKQMNGRRYSLIEMSRPAESKLELSFEGTAGNQVRINVIPEYYVSLKGEVAYTDELPAEAEGKQYYDRTAEIKYSFYDVENQDVQLWTQDFFNHTKIKLTENGQEKELTLNNGVMETVCPVTENMTLETVPDYSDMPVNVISDGALVMKLEGPPVLPAEEPPYGLIAGLAVVGLAAAAIIIAVIIKSRKPKPVPLPPEDRPEPSRYSYTGKLNLYITRTQSGYDIPPLSFNLFRLPSGRVISMKEILESCGVKEVFAGADMIYFKSGANRNLILTNNSDCTIMKNREILMKKKSYQLPLEAKVDITFEDEISELMFQYKD